MENLARYTVIDLTAPLGDSTCTYPTDPPFIKTWHQGFEEAGACCSRLDFGPHAGTHVDAPLHFIEGAIDIGSMDARTFFGPAVAVEALKNPGELIVPGDFDGADVRPGDIVLVRTGWDMRINTPALYDGDWPGFSGEAVVWLAERGAKAIGCDSPSADSKTRGSAGAPAHHAALHRGMPIFETLVNLDRIVGQRVLFFGLPLRLEGVEASPVRAIALVLSD
jgi:kynurenine formamidase